MFEKGIVNACDKMFVVVGSPQKGLENVSACVSLLVLTRAFSHKFDQFKTHSQCLLCTQVQSFGMGSTMVVGTHRQQLFLKQRMLRNNAGLGSQTATHLAENSPVASWGGVAVEQNKARFGFPRKRPLRGLSSGIARQNVQARVVEAAGSGIFCRFKTASNMHTNDSLRKL